MSNDRTKASEEQIAYANILNVGMWIGLAIVIIMFFVYISGVLPRFIPIEDLPKYWGMKVNDFNHTLNAPTGWGWAAPKYLLTGYYVNFIGIAILAGLTILCYAVILPILIRKKDTPYVIIAIAEIAVLALAASGILKTGGH
ncbi:MAG: DUF1634 domain-containing protein [Nitrospiraceae bacterium]|nr:MAG: DUF1634 domain-containing protein [Nitrospiraceae bacterium]